MRLLELLRSASDQLARAGIEDPLADSEVLVFHAAAMDRLSAYTENPEVGQGLLLTVRRMLKRRVSGEPVQYIVGQVDFLGLTVAVGKGVLIPRPETELLVQEAISILKISHTLEPSGKTGQLSVLDLCTGSGCIALALAREFPGAMVYGTDISKKAISYAQKNALQNGIVNAEFRTGSLFSPVKELRFDLITANPPYIQTSEISGLQREVREWEPLRALDGGADGLEYYRRIFRSAAGHLRENGKIVLELGFGESVEVMELAGEAGFPNVTVKKDYAGIERILTAERPVSLRTCRGSRGAART